DVMRDREADEQDMFVRAVAAKLKFTQPVVKKRLGEDRSRRDRRPRHQSTNTRAFDDRITLPVPPPHGALSDHVLRLDAILADVSGSSPPMRNVDGRLVEVR